MVEKVDSPDHVKEAAAPEDAKTQDQPLSSEQHQDTMTDNQTSEVPSRKPSIAVMGSKAPTRNQFKLQTFESAQEIKQPIFKKQPLSPKSMAMGSDLGAVMGMSISPSETSHQDNAVPVNPGRNQQHFFDSNGFRNANDIPERLQLKKAFAMQPSEANYSQERTKFTEWSADRD